MSNKLRKRFGFRNVNKKTNRKICNLLKKEPELVTFLKDVMSGVRFSDAIGKYIKTDNISTSNPIPDYDKLKSSINKRNQFHALMKKKYSDL